MSVILKGLLVLVVLVYISKAQISEAGQECLCQQVRNKMGERSNIKDIQMYQATVFCNKVEIVVTNKNGFRYCLNPNLKAVTQIITRMLLKK